MRIERSFDVVVVGGGVAGLATAYHLKRLGVQRLALAVAGAGVTGLASGQVSGGHTDNFTRLSQAHGAERAVAMWRYGDAAFDALMAYAQEAKVPHLRRRRWRLLTSPAELHEAGLAVAAMTAAGLEAQLTHLAGSAGLESVAAPAGLQAASQAKAADHAGLPASSPAPSKGASQLVTPLPSFAACLPSRVLGVQDDGRRGGWIDPATLLAQLQRDTASIPRLPAVALLANDPAGSQTLTLEDGTTVSTEIVVVAAHLATRGLVPELASALIPYADQWTEWQLAEPQPDLVGLSYSANNTYEWGVFTAPGRLRLGGGRYLRPMAGIEAEVASYEPKITTHLAAKLKETFTFGAAAAPGLGHALLDISPCDELPLIGPLYGSSRVLLAGGFMGAGLTTGFWAGKCLADIISSGQSADLPRFYWPERLRTLST